MITFWTIPRAFTGEFDSIQRRAITSWRSAVFGADIVLVGNEAGVEDFAHKNDFKRIPAVAQNCYGTPLVNDAIKRADQAGRYALMCMISADIVLDESFEQTIKIVSDINRPLVIGQRIDIDKAGNQSLHPPCGIDYFIYRRGTMGDVPPFAVGRTAYDNWLMWNAIKRGLTVIDATSVIKAYHPAHGYPAWPNGKAEMIAGDERAENLRLSNATGCERFFTISDAPFIIAGEEVVPRGR